MPRPLGMSNKDALISRTCKAPVKERIKKGLSAGQVRVLEALYHAKGPLGIHTIEQRAKLHISWIPESLYGRIHDAGEALRLTSPTPAGLAWAAQPDKYPSLLGLGYAEGILLDVDGKQEWCWLITSKGREAMSQEWASQAEKARQKEEAEKKRQERLRKREERAAQDPKHSDASTSHTPSEVA